MRPSVPVGREWTRSTLGFLFGKIETTAWIFSSTLSFATGKNESICLEAIVSVVVRYVSMVMVGSSSHWCPQYYEAVEPLPASRQPLWRTPTKCKTPYDFPPLNNKENADGVEQHKQQVSRHRHHWHRPKTPPGYWDIGFPDTQEVLDINRRAAEMHKRKLVEVEAEAK